MWTLGPTLLVAAAAALTLYCDGIPPELVNKDDNDHAYELTCNKDVEQATIAAGQTISLEGKSGCSIKVGDDEPVTLHVEMVCTISGGKLSCDLL